MTGDARRRLYEIVAQAIEAEPARRADLVEGACGGDAALRDEVLRALERREGLGGFLETSGPARLDLLAPPGPPLPPGATVGRYRLERVIGSGGSGTVYEALQQSPHRKVAVKVMSAGLGSSPAVHRFTEEAEILARLHHPGVAHVYEAGVHEGLPWLAIEYVLGRDIVAHAAGLPVRAKLELMALVCDAVHHGHEQGILHGDLKPTNLLVDAAGRPKVIDFGIARALGADTPGEIAGTPPYMSPEQCEGVRLDVRSDVYAIGAVLYEILAGRRVHDVSGLPLAAGLRTASAEPPVPVERADPRLRGDVAAIVGKALARDRAARYASAAALGDDLRRFLARRPVDARGGEWSYLLSSFARRHWIACAAAATVVVVSVAAAVVSGRLAVENARNRLRAERLAYVASIAAADAAVRSHDIAEARRRLAAAPESRRGWEWDYLAAKLDQGSVIGRGDGTMYVACDPKGTRVAALANHLYNNRGMIHVWDVATCAEIARRDLGPWGSFPFFDGDTILIASPREALRVDAATLEPLAARALDSEWAVAGRETMAALAAGSRLVGGPLVAPRTHADGREGFGLLAWQEPLAVIARLETTEAWDVGAGEMRGRWEKEGVISAAVDLAGGRVALGTVDGSWSVEGARGTTVAGRRPGDSVRAIAFEAGGTRVLTGHESGLLVGWDAAEQAFTLSGHEAAVSSIVWGPLLLSGSSDGTVRLWRLPPPTPEAVLDTLPRLVRDLAYDAAGERLATVSFDGLLRVYSAATRELLRRVPVFDTPERAKRADGSVGCVAFSPDGRTIATGSNDALVRLWEAESGDLLATLEGHASGVSEVLFSPDGGLLGSAAADGTAILWRVHERTELRRITMGPAVAGLAFSPDGRHVAVPFRDGPNGSLRVLDVGTGDETLRRHLGGPDIRVIVYSPDGSRIAVGFGDGSTRILSALSGELVASRGRATRAVEALAYSPDGRRLAAAIGQEVLLCDGETGEDLLKLRGHRALVLAIAFRPDGKQIATAGGDHGGTDCAIRLWGEG